MPESADLSAASPVETLPFSSQPPSLMRRMACWLYEGMLLFGVVFISDYLFSALSQTRHALDNRHFQQAFLFLVLGIYFTWFWSKGQTLAMKTWHIKVVDNKGHPISQTRALIRYVLSWLWFLPPLAAMSSTQLSVPATLFILFSWVVFWAGLSRLRADRQFVHDALAGTRLITFRPVVKKI